MVDEPTCKECAKAIKCFSGMDELGTKHKYMCLKYGNNLEVITDPASICEKFVSKFIPIIYCKHCKYSTSQIEDIGLNVYVELLRCKVNKGEIVTSDHFCPFGLPKEREE